jgi:hypothetical protein
VPLMKLSEPLSAGIRPYFFIAVRMTRTSAANPEMSKSALSNASLAKTQTATVDRQEFGGDRQLSGYTLRLAIS